MKSLFQEQRWFYIPYLLVFIISGIFVINFTKAEIHLWLNNFHSGFFDIFFKYVTYLGDGICIPVFLILLISMRIRYAVYFLSAFLVSGAIVQILKRFVFSDVARPLSTFGSHVPFHWVEDVERLCCHSFPSGHSATAFSFYLCFAIISKEKLVKISMFVLACLVAYSRVYLSQHFLIDIMAGSLIGVITATVFYPLINSLQYPWLDINLKQLLILQKER